MILIADNRRIDEVDKSPPRTPATSCWNTIDEEKIERPSVLLPSSIVRACLSMSYVYVLSTAAEIGNWKSARCENEQKTVKSDRFTIVGFAQQSKDHQQYWKRDIADS